MSLVERQLQVWQRVGTRRNNWIPEIQGLRRTTAEKATALRVRCLGSSSVTPRSHMTQVVEVKDAEQSDGRRPVYMQTLCLLIATALVEYGLLLDQAEGLHRPPPFRLPVHASGRVHDSTRRVISHSHGPASLKPTWWMGQVRCLRELSPP